MVAYAANNEMRTVRIDGSQDSLLFSDPSGVEVMCWLPDGEQLLYRSNRGGALGAWVVRVRNGRIAGSPRLVKANLERTEAVGFGPDGRLYVHTRRGGLDLHDVPIDALTGRRAGSVRPLFRHEPGVVRNQGAWAPDNVRVAYVRAAPLRATSIVVQNTKTGATADFLLDANVIERLVWHPGGQRIAMIAEDAQGQGVFELDLASRKITRILGATNAVEYSQGRRSLDLSSAAYR